MKNMSTEKQIMACRALVGETCATLAAEFKVSPDAVENCAVRYVECLPGYTLEQYLEWLRMPGIGPLRASRSMFTEITGYDRYNRPTEHTIVNLLARFRAIYGLPPLY
jgi:hypothetical protein